MNDKIIFHAGYNDCQGVTNSEFIEEIILYKNNTILFIYIDGGVNLKCPNSNSTDKNYNGKHIIILRGKYEIIHDELFIVLNKYREIKEFDKENYCQNKRIYDLDKKINIKFNLAISSCLVKNEKRIKLESIETKKIENFYLDFIWVNKNNHNSLFVDDIKKFDLE